MQRSSWLIILLVLVATWAGESTNTISNEEENDSGFLVLQQINDLQNENDKAVAQLKDELNNAVKKLLSDLPNTDKKKRRQALQEALAALTGLIIGWPLNGSLSDNITLQAEVGWLLKQQKGWKMDQVGQVSDGTYGQGTPKAMDVTKEFNERFGLQLGHCVSDLTWLQILFNLDLAGALQGLQNPTQEVIEATDRCPVVEPNECLSAVKDALEELQPASQNLQNLRSAYDQLQDSQDESSWCLEMALQEFVEERRAVEIELQEVIREVTGPFRK